MNKIDLERQYSVMCIDGAKGLALLPDKTIKLVYGSPPYPNADRDYGMWRSSEYIKKIAPFIDQAADKLRDDGFLVINVKANRERHKSNLNTTRSLVIEKFAIMLEEHWNLHCVDIEIWLKDNPVTTGLRVACQDAYEQILWFSKTNPWQINLEDIRRPYSEGTFKKYESLEYKPRGNGLSYVRKSKKIQPNPNGALPLNVIKGAVMAGKSEHQARQPGYIPEKYIKATTAPGDLVVDPWMGTGTTGIEAVTLERRFIGFDIYESFVNVAEREIGQAIEYKQQSLFPDGL